MRMHDQNTFKLHELQKAYDFIIVGGGTAGCVLASRLSEDENLTVLVLEKGRADFPWTSRVPLLSSNFQNGSRTVSVRSEPQIHVGGRSVELVVGQALGGTSRINGMLYTRGLPAEYDAWSQSGRKGWSYDDLHPYFLKSERALDVGLDDNHNSSGEWRNRSHSKRFFASSERVIESAKKLGFSFIEDINASDHPAVGITKFHYTIDENGHRSDTASAFLPQKILQSRKTRLHVCAGVAVSRLDIRTSADGPPVVTGVYVQSENGGGKDDASRLVVANKEVIVCAGPFGSPQLLMLSGIGPREHLASHGITVHKDLPGVGSNLDHVSTPLLYNVPLADSLLKMQKKPWVALRETVKYLLWGTGLLLGPVHELSLFARSDSLLSTLEHSPDRRGGTDIPDIEIMMIAWGKPEAIPRALGGFALFAVPLRPLSLGTVRLRSSDPRDPPLCDPNLLSAPEDRATLHTAMRLCHRIKEQMEKDGYPITDCAVPKSGEAKDLDRHIEEWGMSIYHYTSSCRMAPEDDVRPGVVDGELRVHGVRGVRVADSSIFPNILATHLQAATVMVAEKCADLLKKSLSV